MSAFTYLGSIVNISLAHSTMTIYSKNAQPLFILKAPFAAKNVPIENCIVRSDSEHKFYHDDSFHIDTNHSHIKFACKMTEENLEKVLSVLIEQHFLTEEEKLGFLKSFKIANDAAWERFNSDLMKLKQKAEQLTQKAAIDPQTYQPAANAANTLYQKVNDETDTYIRDKNLQSYEHFKAECATAMDTARPILEEHRGCKKLLCNLAAAIAGLIVFYLLAATINYYQTNGKHFFFQFNTDSVNHMEHFQDAQNGLLRV